MRRYQSGVTLIDVMVSVVLFSIGVLGLVALQANSVQTSFNSEARISAPLLADDMVAFFIGNKGAIPSGTVYSNWQTQVASALPGGLGNVSGTAGNDMTVTITWATPSQTASGSSSGSSSGGGSSSGSQYITHVYWP